MCPVEKKESVRRYLHISEKRCSDGIGIRINRFRQGSAVLFTGNGSWESSIYYANGDREFCFSTNCGLFFHFNK